MLSHNILWLKKFSFKWREKFCLRLARGQRELVLAVVGSGSDWTDLNCRSNFRFLRKYLIDDKLEWGGERGERERGGVKDSLRTRWGCGERGERERREREKGERRGRKGEIEEEGDMMGRRGRATWGRGEQGKGVEGWAGVYWPFCVHNPTDSRKCFARGTSRDCIWIFFWSSRVTKLDFFMFQFCVCRPLH